jgi:hypothetical protein
LSDQVKWTASDGEYSDLVIEQGQMDEFGDRLTEVHVVIFLLSTERIPDPINGQKEE